MFKIYPRKTTISLFPTYPVLPVCVNYQQIAYIHVKTCILNIHVSRHNFGIILQLLSFLILIKVQKYFFNYDWLYHYHFCRLQKMQWVYQYRPWLEREKSKSWELHVTVLVRNHLLGTYTKFSKKVTFLTPCMHT